MKTFKITLPPEALKTWWRSFNDAELNRLRDTALAGNLEVNIALARSQAATTTNLIAVYKALAEGRMRCVEGVGWGDDRNPNNNPRIGRCWGSYRHPNLHAYFMGKS